MRTSTLAFGFALALSGSVLAQNPDVQAGASSESSTSVAASRSGAAARHEEGGGAALRPEYATASIAQGSEINATLTKPVDSRHAKPGDEVTAAFAQDTQAGGQIMQRGTKLVGHVTEAQARGRRSDSASPSASGSNESRLGIVFDKAILEGGREVPVNAMIQAIAASEAVASGNARGIESAAGGSALGSGRVSSSGPLGGGGIVGGVTGTAGSALGGAPNVGAGLGAAASSVGSASKSSAGAVGGLSVAGRLMSGSRGVFGMGGVDIASTAAGGAQGSYVLTSRTGNIGLERGTQLLLVEATGSAQGAVGGAAGGTSAAGNAVGSVAVGASETRRE